MTQGHFTGVAVVIDDEVKHTDKAINMITKAILDSGGHVVGMEKLPASGTNYRNFAGASFFILDWNLEGVDLAIEGGGGATIPLPAVLAEEKLAEKVEFLTELRKTRLAPVFIFTAEPVHHVKKALKKYQHLYVDDGTSHIFIMNKEEVIANGVFKVLNDWVNKHPSALALKLWEEQYEVAKNEVFLNFYNQTPLWPAILWRTFQKDGVPASDELGQVISRNLTSRMLPITIDMEAFDADLGAAYKKDPEAYRKTLLKVLEGERFVSNLHPGSIAPGDVFKDDGVYWINIRPDCDCIERDGEPAVILYLLRGKKLSPGEIHERMPVPAKGRFIERDDEAVVFAMCGGETVTFGLKTLHQKEWGNLASKRIGRLLPPFSTRVQQRYASYLQRPGLPMMPIEAMPKRLRDDADKQAAEAAAKAAVSDPRIAPVAPARMPARPAPATGDAVAKPKGSDLKKARANDAPTVASSKRPATKRTAPAKKAGTRRTPKRS